MNLESKRKRIIEISKKLQLSHVGSCLSVLPILEEIYKEKKPEDKVFLSGAHSHLAHLMFTNPEQAEELIQKDIHCNKESGCDFNGGSLGHLGIALGTAIARPDIKVYAIITDGSFHEGSEMEALRLKQDLLVSNLYVHANFNGYTATKQIDRDRLAGIANELDKFITIHYTDNYLPELDGVKGHYDKLS